MISLTSKNIRLLLCAALTTGALACGGAEAEQGAQGPQGPLGEQGEPGEAGQPGTDGEDGDDGDDGTDGEAGLNSLVITESVEPGDVCANGGVTVSVGIDANGDEVLDEDEVDASETVCNQNDAVEDLCDEAFAITGVTGVEQALFAGQVSDPITVATNDDANLSLAFVGGDTLEPVLTSDASFTITPQDLGENQQITVVAAGQCGSDVITIALPEVTPYESYLSVVHLFPGAEVVDVAPSGTLDIITTLGFPDASGPVPLTPGEFSFDLLDLETVVATSDTYTLEPSTAYSLIVHDEGGSLAFTLIEDDLTEPSGEDTFRGRIVHMADLAGTVDVSAGLDTESLAPLATGVAPGDVGTFAEYDQAIEAIQIDAGGTLLTYVEDVDIAFFDGDIANIYVFNNDAGNVRLLVHYLNVYGTSLLSANPTTPLFNFEDGILPTEFITGGDLPWESTDGRSSEGTYALTSGAITHSERSELEITLEFTAPGTFVFDWNVSSESGWDFLFFCDDTAASCDESTAVETFSGTFASWTSISYEIPAAGSYTFSWVYEKDSGFSSGSDQGWIDNLRFVQPEPSFL